MVIHGLSMETFLSVNFNHLIWPTIRHSICNTQELLLNYRFIYTSLTSRNLVHFTTSYTFDLFKFFLLILNFCLKSINIVIYNALCLQELLNSTCWSWNGNHLRKHLTILSNYMTILYFEIFLKFTLKMINLKLYIWDDICFLVLLLNIWNSHFVINFLYWCNYIACS